MLNIYKYFMGPLGGSKYIKNLKMTFFGPINYFLIRHGE
jgi:hypothetical protein